MAQRDPNSPTAIAAREHLLSLAAAHARASRLASLLADPSQSDTQAAALATMLSDAIRAAELAFADCAHFVEEHRRGA